MPPQTRGRVIALTRMTPPPESGLSHWSTRTLADHLKRRESIRVSFHYVAPYLAGGESEAAPVGHLQAVEGTGVRGEGRRCRRPVPGSARGRCFLSVDEKMRVQALDRTRSVLPVAFAATEKRAHEYVGHGATNLFAALNVATGEVLGECEPNRNGANFLAFLKKTVKPHAGKEIHIVLDNLSTHPPGREGMAGEELSRALPFHPRGLFLAEPD
ncbi:transposase [Streptomyces ambofaciens]